MTHPIDYSSPLGISKREWAWALGANLALLLAVYAVALVCTLCGSGAFLIKTQNESLVAVENSLRSIGMYPLIQMGFATIEETIILMYVMKSKPRWWWPLIHFGTYVGLNFLMMATIGYVWQGTALALGIAYCAALITIRCIRERSKPWVFIFRFLIATAISFLFNGAITIFRTSAAKIGGIYENTQFFYLSMEYNLAIGLALGFLTLVIPWKKGGTEQWEMPPDAGGSSPTMTKWSRKSSPTKKNKLTPKQRKRLLFLKTKVILIQTVALVIISFVPIFFGKGTEFALIYLSFCLTRLVLGFSRSLHFKSELACVTLGALSFWALTFLAPTMEVSLILSLCYGAALALGFRLYWELHDLIMYRKASKTDRYAMFYVVFKGNCDPKHINGVMRAKGYSDRDDIRMTQMYMQRDKVEYIADFIGYAKITIEKRLTEIATDLYQHR